MIRPKGITQVLCRSFFLPKIVYIYVIPQLRKCAMKYAGYQDEISGIMSRRRNRVLETAFELFTKGTIESVNMTDIADAAEMGVASLYRYFGTKAHLVVELMGRKWQQYFSELETRYDEHNGMAMTAREELDFFLNSYIDLFEHHKPLLCFNANFDQYIRQENVSKEELDSYDKCMGQLREIFHRGYQKALTDHTLRLDIPESEMFFSIVYTMLGTSQKFATEYSFLEASSINPLRILKMQKQMFLQLATPQE